jgi:MFS family permease
MADSAQSIRILVRVNRVTKVFYLLASLVLFAIALGLIGYAVVEIVRSGWRLDSLPFVFLDNVGFVIVALAVLDVAKFLLEEEVLREREMGTAHEARFGMTKFMTIIIIAFSLEALVLVFEIGKEHPPQLVFPVVLFLSAVVALVGLGLFQWLSKRAEESTRVERP